jgi:CubicO group peptidase (beta-lactamase class C family)
MHSVAKAVTAVCVYMLVERGLLDPDAPVARYWPEFGQNGKERLPLRYVLDHRAGLAYPTEPLPRGAAYEPGRVAAALARQAPLWEPGTAAGYHVLTQGFIVAEVVKRVTGDTLAAFLRREVAGPLSLDYHFGVPEADLSRCAEQITGPDDPIRISLREPHTAEGRFWALYAEDEDFNSRAYRTAEISSDAGHGNARALARLFGVLVNGGSEDGVRLMRPETLARMTTEQHNLTEIYLGRHYHQGSGVVLNSPPVSYQGPNAGAFGHHGVGGSIAFGDPTARLGFAYGVNRLALTAAGRDGLVEATYRALAG